MIHQGCPLTAMAIAICALAAATHQNAVMGARPNSSLTSGCARRILRALSRCQTASGSSAGSIGAQISTSKPGKTGVGVPRHRQRKRGVNPPGSSCFEVALFDIALQFTPMLPIEIRNHQRLSCQWNVHHTTIAAAISNSLRICHQQPKRARPHQNGCKPDSHVDQKIHRKVLTIVTVAAGKRQTFF